MNSKTRIKKLTVEGFRGARKKAHLDLEDENKNVVLYGNNGDGKTTFSDALEWFFTDRIDYLNREGCGREDYFNRYIEKDRDGIVEIEFSNPILDCKKMLLKQGGFDFSNASSEFSRYIRESSKDSLILRHHTMREFIDKTKKEKLESLEDIIGFGIVREIRDVLLKTLNSLKDDTELTSLSGKLNERKRDLIEAIGKDKFEDSDILDYGSKLVRECDPALSMTNEFDFEHVVETLEKRVASSDRGKQLLTLDGINKNVLKLVEMRDNFVEVGNVVKRHNELAKERDTIEASAIEKLYRAAIEAIESKSVRAGKCPLCKRPTDTESLLDSLKSEMGKLEEVLRQRKTIVQNAKSLLGKITSYQSELKPLLELEEVSKKTLFTTNMEKITTNMPTLLSQHEEVLNKIQQYPQKVSLPSLKVLGNIEEEVKASQQKVSLRKEAVSETEEEKKFYQNVIKLRNLLSDYKRYKELIVQIFAFLKQIDSFEKIYESFERMERENIRKVLKAISNDVNDFFVFLHPDDDISEVELIPTEERGIEFKLRRHGEEISPPLKILSEAHLNSLGICLFLASAK
jgi:DNA repair exonuclease SbcCD ATPase subunit